MLLFFFLLKWFFWGLKQELKRFNKWFLMSEWNPHWRFKLKIKLSYTWMNRREKNGTCDRRLWTHRGLNCHSNAQPFIVRLPGKTQPSAPQVTFTQTAFWNCCGRKEKKKKKEKERKTKAPPSFAKHLHSFAIKTAFWILLAGSQWAVSLSEGPVWRTDGTNAAERCEGTFEEKKGFFFFWKLNLK